MKTFTKIAILAIAAASLAGCAGSIHGTINHGLHVGGAITTPLGGVGGGLGVESGSIKAGAGVN